MEVKKLSEIKLADAKFVTELKIRIAMTTSKMKLEAIQRLEHERYLAVAEAEMRRSVLLMKLYKQDTSMSIDDIKTIMLDDEVYKNQGASAVAQINLQDEVLHTNDLVTYETLSRKGRKKVEDTAALIEKIESKERANLLAFKISDCRRIALIDKMLSHGDSQTKFISLISRDFFCHAALLSRASQTVASIHGESMHDMNYEL